MQSSRQRQANFGFALARMARPHRWGALCAALTLMIASALLPLSERSAHADASNPAPQVAMHANGGATDHADGIDRHASGCAMSTCHPAITAFAVEIADGDVRYVYEILPRECSAVADPGIDLPPPRASDVCSGYQ